MPWYCTTPASQRPSRNGHVLLHYLEIVYVSVPDPPSLIRTCSPHGCSGGGVRAGLMPWVMAKGKAGHAENKAAQVGIMKSIFAIVLWGLFTWATLACIVRQCPRTLSRHACNVPRLATEHACALGMPGGGLAHIAYEPPGLRITPLSNGRL